MFDTAVMKRVLFAALVLATVIAISQASSGTGDRTTPIVFHKALNLIQEQYIEKPEFSDLIRHAISGMAREYPDDIPGETVVALLPPDTGPDDQRRGNDALQRTLNLMRERLGDRFDQTEAYRDAIEGMVSGLTMDGTRDYYSSYLRPQSRKQLQDQLRGSFQGVGIVIEFKDGRLMVVRPIEGSPAHDAGIEVGDEIVAVDGRPLPDIPITNADEAAKRIRGPVGSSVDLTVRRGGLPAPLTFSLKRARVKDVNNLRKEMLTDTIGYLSLRGFTQESADDLADALRYLETQGMRGLVLDLRWNPGGLLDMAVAVADLFLQPDILITYTQGRDVTDYQEYRSSEKAVFTGPMVVLVNEFSASASEIVAGALRDNQRAELIGLRTFGKGSVQEIYRFPDDSALRLTVAKYYTPAGGCIHALGIEPNHSVELVFTNPEGPEEEGSRWKRDSQCSFGVEKLIAGTGAAGGEGNRVSDAGSASRGM